jgi:hypothetical protein
VVLAGWHVGHVRRQRTQIRRCRGKARRRNDAIDTQRRKRRRKRRRFFLRDASPMTAAGMFRFVSTLVAAVSTRKGESV